MSNRQIVEDGITIRKVHCVSSDTSGVLAIKDCSLPNKGEACIQLGIEYQPIGVAAERAVFLLNESNALLLRHALDIFVAENKGSHRCP